jgi:hypothetical protein
MNSYHPFGLEYAVGASLLANIGSLFASKLAPTRSAA